MNLDHANPELFAALAVAQAEVENATKGSTNPHFKSKYADLAEVLNTVRPVFAKQGLSLVQSTSFDGSLVSVTTALCHKSGGYITSVASCAPAKIDAQGVGAATTYLRRYSLAAITGVAQEDDDGNSAAHSTPPVTRVERPVVNTESVDHAVIEAGVKAVQEALARDQSAQAQILEIYDLHHRFNKLGVEAYTAIADALVARKVMTKAQWRDTISTAKKTEKEAA